MKHQTKPFPAALPCPRWPGCDCPDGTMRLDCPGRIDALVRPGFGAEPLPFAARPVPARMIFVALVLILAFGAGLGLGAYWSF